MNSSHHGDKDSSPNPPSPVKLRWWIACFVSAIVLSPIISVVLGLYLPNQHFQDNQEGARSGFIGRAIQFEVVLISVDPIQGVMTLDWNIIGETESSCSPVNLTACTPVNIFFDGNLIRQGSDGDISSSDRPTKPVFRHNATGFVLKDILNNSPTFRTQVALFSPGYTASSLLYYPFDRYSAEVFLFAQDATTNNSVGVIFEKTRGIAVGFTTEVVSRTDTYIPPGIIDVYIILSRGRFVKLYAIAATITVWMITLTLLLVMVTSVFFGFRQKGEILVVPVATLFAFTQLRNSMPGAPDGFGDILDFVGLLPCLAILSVSASLILAAFIFTDPTQGHHSGISLQQVYDALWLKKDTRDAERHGDIGPGYEMMATRSPSLS